jgi:hypothetical protein
MTVESIPAYSEIPGGEVVVYNEAAFRHFLAVDRWRAARSRRFLLLVLVTVRQNARPRLELTESLATALFLALGACVREVDFVGWYREGHVVGAVLAQPGKTSIEVPRAIAQRMLGVLTNRLSADHSRNLRLRVVRLGGGKLIP